MCLLRSLWVRATASLAETLNADALFPPATLPHLGFLLVCDDQPMQDHLLLLVGGLQLVLLLVDLVQEPAKVVDVLLHLVQSPRRRDASVTMTVTLVR